MPSIPFTTILMILILFAAYVAILGLASYKMIKSKLPDLDKIYWTVAMVIFNLIAAIPFILYHDYFMSRDKRHYKT